MVEVNKNCDTCRSKDTCVKTDCHENTRFYGWEGDYQTLESQLANTKMQIQQLEADKNVMDEEFDVIKSDFYDQIHSLESQLSKTQSQLAKADEIIQRDIVEIAGYRDAIEGLLNVIESGPDCFENFETDISDGGYLGHAVNPYCEEVDKAEQALSTPAPVDTEKEVLKEALSEACRRFGFHMNTCPAELISDFDNNECRDICDQYQNRLFECWIKYFTNQARSRTAEGEKK